jgi:hypothetical protein
MFDHLVIYTSASSTHFSKLVCLVSLDSAFDEGTGLIEVRRVADYKNGPHFLVMV